MSRQKDPYCSPFLCTIHLKSILRIVTYCMTSLCHHNDIILYLLILYKSFSTSPGFQKLVSKINYNLMRRVLLTHVLYICDKTYQDSSSYRVCYNSDKLLTNQSKTHLYYKRSNRKSERGVALPLSFSIARV